MSDAGSEMVAFLLHLQPNPWEDQAAVRHALQQQSRFCSASSSTSLGVVLQVVSALPIHFWTPPLQPPGVSISGPTTGTRGCNGKNWAGRRKEWESVEAAGEGGSSCSVGSCTPVASPPFFYPLLYRAGTYICRISSGVLGWHRSKQTHCRVGGLPAEFQILNSNCKHHPLIGRKYEMTGP